MKGVRYDCKHYDGRPTTRYFACIILSLFISESILAQQPTSVIVSGSFQSELGCSGDWDPSCATTGLSYDANDDTWQGTFNIPSGSWEYKAALNDSWDEHYGLNAIRNGSNIPLNLASTTTVKFYYSHSTHWITDNANSRIVTAAGSFQSEIGCPGDWDPSCLRSWLQDPDGDNTFTFTTSGIPPGNYEVKAAVNETWDENYGEGGVPGGANIAFTVSQNNSAVLFSFNGATNVLTVTVTPLLPSVCPLPKGYWRNNPNAWSTGATPMLLGSLSYSKAQLLTIVSTPIGSGNGADASLLLATQLIAAKLNIANGAAAPSPVSDSIASADGVISGHTIPMGVKPNTPLGKRMNSLNSMLERYNSGALNSGCPISKSIVNDAGGEKGYISIPRDFALDQNYPNPFNPTTTIRYDLPQDARMTLEVCDVLGRHVAELVNGEMEAGYHEAEFNASSMASGIYFYRMTVDGADGQRFVQVRKLILLK